MAKFVAIRLAMIFAAVLFAMPMVYSSHTKTITLYGLVISDGPNANVISVAGNPDNPGTTFVFDTPLSESANPGSPEVGRGQGIEVITSVNRDYFTSSLYFDQGEYRGSSLELQGTIGVAGLGFEGELSVTGGTGYFRSVSGYAQQSTFQRIAGTNNTINRLEIFLKSDLRI